MKVYVNNRNEIKDVNSTTDLSLVELEINDDGNPFANWSVAKICCHKVEVENSMVTKFSPYIDTRIIEHIEKLGKRDESVASDILDTQIGLTETFEKTVSAEEEITEMQLAIVEIYEMLVGGAQ